MGGVGRFFMGCGVMVVDMKMVPLPEEEETLTDYLKKQRVKKKRGKEKEEDEEGGEVRGRGVEG